MKFIINPSPVIAGKIQVAADKSISHRAIILGSLANGITRVRGLLEGEDVLATIAAFRAMGVSIERIETPQSPPLYEIKGVGLYGLTAPKQPLDMGNSGTAYRLLAGILCAQPWQSELTGDSSLRARPMGRIIEPLSEMGADIVAHDGAESGYPPLKFRAVTSLSAIAYPIPMASAQVKSAILLAGLYARGISRIEESAPTRDHTERMLAGFGYAVSVEKSAGTPLENQAENYAVTLRGGGELHAQEMEVPADLSSAAFFILAGLLAKEGEIILTGVGNNPSRNGVFSILQSMGGQIERVNQREIGGEPVVDVIVKPSDLSGCEIGGKAVALAIDEIPCIAVAAAVASGVTVISGAQELRVKESDRIKSVVNGLRALGVDASEQADGMTIRGGRIFGGKVDSGGDHRIAMAFSMAGVAANNAIEIDDCANVATSFPNFCALAKQVGVDIDTRHSHSKLVTN